MLRLDAKLVELPCSQDCCCKKDCVFPLLFHWSPPAETGRTAYYGIMNFQRSGLIEAGLVAFVYRAEDGMLWAAKGATCHPHARNPSRASKRHAVLRSFASSRETALINRFKLVMMSFRYSQNTSARSARLNNLTCFSTVGAATPLLVLLLPMLFES